LKFVLALLGAGAGEGGIKKWARDHRAHHRYVDTDQDPYSVHHGFFHAHIGWVIFKNNQGPQGTIATGRVDIIDLKSDPIVMWQEHNYWQLLVLMGYVLPTVFSGLCWGDFIGGFVIVGCLGTSAVQQCTFCVNSVAHWIGEQPFEATGSPRDHFITAFLTSGEGYHNFHHEFPIDYRNGIRWYDYDPTKWVIWLFGQIGLATNLRQFPHNEIEKGRLQRRREVLEKEYKMLDWGMPVEKMPFMEWEEFQQQARTGCNLIVIRGFVYEVSKFVTEHPGGAAMITGAIGKDATEMFGGGVHRHSNAATNLLDTMRMAVIGKVRRTEGQADLNDD
jgi:stearoyl-CoA desaturase (delta-9 desaturase)